MIVYRQLTYLVVLQSAVTALGGNRLRWHRLGRTGSARQTHGATMRRLIVLAAAVVVGAPTSTAAALGERRLSSPR
jgi:hypothetical protein